MKNSGLSLRSTRYIWLCTAVLLVAAFLRIYHLNLQGLWGDEGWSVMFSEPRTPRAITHNLIDDLHPPLYFILLGFWRDLSGSSEVAMRLLAVWPSLITVAIIARIGYKILGPATALTAALVLALSDKHVLLSQEVRHYPLAFMWMAASSLIFLNWVERPTRRRTLLYALVLILSVYTHYYTSLILLVQLLYAVLIVRPWQRVFKLGLMMGLASLAFVPWAIIAVHQIQIRPEGIRHSLPLAWSTLDLLSVDFLGRPVSLMVGLLVLGVVMVRHQERRWTLTIRHQPQLWYAVLWLVAPIILTILIFDYVTLLTDRNMALLVLPIALLVGHGITSFRPPASLLLALLLTFNGLASLDSYSDHPPWREMAQYVAANYPAGEPVVMDVKGGDMALGYHLRQALPADTRLVNLNAWRLEYVIYFDGVIQDFLKAETGFWVAYWGPPTYELDSLYQNFGYTRTAAHSENHLGSPIWWYHYDKVPSVDNSLATFGDTIRLHQVKVPGGGRRGEAMSVSLWWSSATSLDTSYSVSVFLLDAEGVLRAQHDGPPQDGQAPTTRWQPDAIVFDTHHLPIPKDLPTGEYRLAVKVYNSANGTILSATHGDASDSDYWVVDSVTVR